MFDKIYIDGVLADTTDKVIALTIRGYSPLSPTKILLSFSNSIVFPLTNTNRSIFGLSENINSSDTGYKSTYAIRYVRDGIEIVPNGRLSVMKYDEAGYHCVIFQDEYDLYSAIKEKTINELDYTDVNDDWTTSSIDDTFIRSAFVLGGDGDVFCSVVNFGNNILDNAGTIEYLQAPTAPDYQWLPISYGYKQILTRIIEQAGFNADFGTTIDPTPLTPTMPSFVAAGAMSTSTVSATITVTAPALSEDDLMVCFLFGKNNIDILGDTLTEWTRIGTQVNSGTGLTTTMFYKFAGPTDSGGTFDFDKDSNDGNLFAGLIAAWTDVSQDADVITSCGTPSSSANASSDTVTYATFSPSKRCHVVAAGFYGDDNTTAGTISGTNPTLTNRFDIETPFGSDGSIFGYSGDSDGAPTGARSHSTTSTADAVSVGFMFGIAPVESEIEYTEFQRLTVMQRGESGDYQIPYSSKFNSSVEFEGTNSIDREFTDLGAATASVINMDSVVKPCSFWYSGPGPYRYEVTNADTALSYYNGDFRFWGIVELVTGSGEVAIYKNSTKAASVSLTAGTNNIDLTLAADQLNGLKDGDIVNFRIYQVGANPFNAIVRRGCRASFECVGAYPSGYVYFNQSLPELNQLDFFKDFLFRVGVVPKFSNKTITFKTLKEILADQTSLNDWTNKRLDDKVLIETDLGLGQTNYYQYEAMSDTYDKYASGNFTLDNENLDLEAVYTSVFSGSYDGITEGINCAQVLCQDAADEDFFNVDIGARLLRSRVKYDHEPSIRTVGSGAVRSDYTISEFSTLSYDNVLRDYYTTSGEYAEGFLARLKDAKFVTIRYNLSSVDIFNFDPHKMVFDEGQYYLFPVFKDVVSGKGTEVTMLKI